MISQAQEIDEQPRRNAQLRRKLHEPQFSFRARDPAEYCMLR